MDNTIADKKPERNVVIIGGGIIGCTTAYYLTRHPAYSPSNTNITVFENHAVAAGASGKAGGLVATWAFPKALAMLSFAEHSRLAAEHGGGERWGWRYTKSAQWEGRSAGLEDDVSSRREKKSDSILPKDLDWIIKDLTDDFSFISKEGETAQVHPYQFTTSMCKFAQESGAQLIISKVISINMSKGNTRRVKGITYVDSNGEEKTHPATHVVLSAGPWSSKLIPSLPIYGTRAHSIVIRPTRELSAYAVFTEIALPSSTRSKSKTTVVQPEIYTRPNNEVYVSTTADDEPLPESVADVKVNEHHCDTAFKEVGSISQELKCGEVLVKQACYLPNVSIKTTPILGEVKNVEGLIVASGHTCWVCEFFILRFIRDLLTIRRVFAMLQEPER